MIQDNEMKDNLLSLLEISLGKEIMKYMQDKDIIEIMKNDDGKVFADSLTKGEFYIGDMNSIDAENVVKLVANHVNQEVTPENPMCLLSYQVQVFVLKEISLQLVKHQHLI